jgi:hypothetical protein
MFGKKLSAFAAQKRLLVTESGINRVRRREDWQAMVEGVRSLADRVKSSGPLLSAAALLVGALWLSSGVGPRGTQSTKTRKAKSISSWPKAFDNGPIKQTKPQRNL